MAAVAVLITTATPASACSCASGDARDALARADAAIIGTVLSRTPSGEQGASFTFRIDEEVKGDFGETVNVSSANNGAACGLEVGIGQQTGLFLSGSDSEGWSSSLCQQISPEDLREAAQPMPAPDGEGPIRLIAGGNWGEMGLFGLDSEGRTLIYGERPGGSTVEDVCPGSSVFIEVPWRGKQRWVVRETATFEIVDIVYPPKRARPEQCLADDASEVLVYSVEYGEPLSKSTLFRYHDGIFEKLYEGNSSWFEVVGDNVYLTEGRYGRNVKVLDLTTGAKSLITRLPRNVRYVQGVAVSPDETHLATRSGADREKLIVIDRTTSPPTVRIKGHGIGRSGEVYWLDNETFVYLPGGYDNDTAKIFDRGPNLISSLDGGWYTLDEEIVDNVAYGAGWGLLFRAALPGGPAEVLREFPSPEIYSVAVVPDEVHVQNP